MAERISDIFRKGLIQLLSKSLPKMQIFTFRFYFSTEELYLI